MSPDRTGIDIGALKRRSALRLILSLPFFAVLFFLPAGTICYWQAWLFIASLYLPMLCAFVYLIRKNPELLARRLQYTEKDRGQRLFIIITSIYLLIAFFIPGLDQRFHWSEVPPWLSVLADIVFVGGYGLFFRVLQVNSYASRLVEVMEGQKLIATGPYALVRHPMYLAIMIMYGITPLALGSFWGLLASAPLPFILAYRIATEERMLVQDLAGYEDYRRQVRWRLLPYVW